MKSAIVYLTAAFLTLGMFSCSQPEKEETKDKGKFPPLNGDFAYAYPLDSAQRDIALYDSMFTYLLSLDSAYAPDTANMVRAFTIHNEDLLRAMGVTDPAVIDQCQYHVRAYIGYHRGEGFKLFVVPADSVVMNDPSGLADKAGTDLMVNAEGFPIPSPAPSPKSSQYVLDFNSPCPQFCDEASPLYQ